MVIHLGPVSADLLLFKSNISESNIRSSLIVYLIPNMNIPLEHENREKGQMISLVLLRTAAGFEKKAEEKEHYLDRSLKSALW